MNAHLFYGAARRAWPPLAFAVSAMLFASAALSGPDTHLSVEIDALAPPGATRLERIVKWAELNRATILRDERRFNVDRRAIATFVAYESIGNVRGTTMGGLARFVGPGKIHYKAEYLQLGRTLAEDVETRGLLPRHSLRERIGLLSQSDGAIDYIAAIMSLFSGTGESYGYSIRCDSDALITLMTAWDYPDAVRRFSERRTLQPNDAALRARQFAPAIEAAVGKPAAAMCRPAR